LQGRIAKLEKFCLTCLGRGSAHGTKS
jgi:hypothetical protein